MNTINGSKIDIAFEKRCAGQGGFLEHVEGLRGLAIVLVMLFHLDGAYWVNGYLGVDVFLVISGYLLWRGLVARPEPGGWREAVGFMGRRVQRIVPGMAVVIMLAVGMGVLLLIPEDELFLAREGEQSLVGTVNVFLRREFRNYFASEAAFNPLLHLWYLAVILQVYLIWAVGKPLLQRVPKKWALAVVWTLGVVSWLRCYSFPIHELLQEWGAPVWKQHRDISYYATLPRVWEVLAGGLVLLLPSVVEKKHCATVFTICGVLAILIPALEGVVPGLMFLSAMPKTLIVVVGTVLVLKYAPESRLELLLSNRPLRWLGKISFSLYLVHMPLFVYGKMWLFWLPTQVGWAALVVGSLVAGWLFYHGIEKRKCRWPVVVALWIGAFMLCYTGHRCKGFEQINVWGADLHQATPYRDWQTVKNPPKLVPEFTWQGGVYSILKIPAGERPKEKPQLLQLGDASQKPSMVLMGDSFAYHLYAGLNEVMKAEGWSGVYLSTIVYPFDGWVWERKTDPGSGSISDWTSEKQQALLNWLQEHPEITHIVLGQSWRRRLQRETWSMSDRGQFEPKLRAFLEKIKPLGKKVILMDSTPEYSGSAPHYTKIGGICHLAGVSTPRIEMTAEQYRQLNQPVTAILYKLQEEGLCTLIEPIKILEPGESFQAMEDGISMMYDRDHLSWEGSIRMVRRLLPQFKKALDKE